MWLLLVGHASSPRPPVTPSRECGLTVFLTFRGWSRRRHLELPRLNRGDPRRSAARRAGQEARVHHAVELVDLYGAPLVAVATVVSGDCSIARAAVVRVIVAVSLDCDRREPSRLTLAELSRLTMWACGMPTATAAAVVEGPLIGPVDAEVGHGDGDLGALVGSVALPGRTLLALTWFGDHTYREAAVVLGMAPEVAADLLRGALHTIADTNRRDARFSSTGEQPGALAPLPETREAMAEFVTLDEPEIDEVIEGLGRRAREIVPEVVGLSLGLVREGVTFTLVASNSGLAVLDATQYLDGGPCVEVTEARRDVVEFAMDDPLDEGRWLLFAQASAAVGVASSLSLPLLRDGRVIGGINLYASTGNAFTGRHDQLADALDASASGAVTNADLSFATRLQAARALAKLRNDQEIETATGLLAGRYDQDVDLAGARLRDAAARAGVDEALVARLMIMVHNESRGPS